MKTNCEHEWGQWVTLAGSVDTTRRHCTKCGLSQKISVSYKYEDDGYDKRLLDRKKSDEELQKARKSKTGSIGSYDGYAGYNEGLGVYVRSKSHYKELLKETNSVEVG